MKLAAQDALRDHGPQGDHAQDLHRPPTLGDQEPGHQEDRRQPDGRAVEPVRVLDGDVADHLRHRAAEAGGPVGTGEAGIGVGDHAAGDDEDDGEKGGSCGEAADCLMTAPPGARFPRRMASAPLG